MDASPGAAKTEITGINPWRGAIQIRIAAEPKEGAANEELVRFLAKRLGLAAPGVSIVRGERSSRKTLHIQLDTDEVKRLLESE